MLFNSLDFIYFFLPLFGLMLILKHPWQNRLLLVGSYFFYAFGSWPFALLLFFSSWIDFLCGKKIQHHQNHPNKKKWLWLSLSSNLGLLILVKYIFIYIPFSESLLQEYLTHPTDNLDKILIPTGISFYTFQTLGYTLDVYRSKTQPCDKFENFALYVAFFPQPIAGPIERSSSLLPQILNERCISATGIKDGALLFAWGLYKKVVVADNIAPLVQQIFSDPQKHQGFDIVIAAYAFAIQLYADFSGYTDMARGLGKMMGFSLRKNFHFPYLARSPGELWQKWHISLSTWIRDYLFYPLLSKRISLPLATFLTFFVMGLWHGCGLNFALLGFYWGTTMSFYVWFRRFTDRSSLFKTLRLSRFYQALGIIFTFNITCFSYIFFRAESPSHAFQLIQSLFNTWGSPEILWSSCKTFLLYCPLMLIAEIFFLVKGEKWFKERTTIAWCYLIAPLLLHFLLLLLFSSKSLQGGHEFIYFQF